MTSKKIHKPKKVAVILGDPQLPDAVKRDHHFNAEDFATLEQLYATLATLPDYEFSYLNSHSTLIEDLKHAPPEFVFNLCDEGFYNFAKKELHIPAFLEMLNIPYSGAAPACLAICYNKSLVRACAKEMGIPVPLESYLEPNTDTSALHSFFPALVKPNCGDSSLGITQNSLVHNDEELQNYLKFLAELVPEAPILIQEYLTGAEYSVGLIGNEGDFNVLPILTVDYHDLPDDLPPILGYESKWLPDSPYWNNIHYLLADLPKEQNDALIDYAKQLFVRLECRDYARFDFRMDQQGTPKLLEVNPNPGWSWDAKMNIMAGFAGYSYADLLKMIIETGLKRYIDNA